MKVCLIFSIVVATLVILLAFFGKQNVFEVGGSVLPTVGLQMAFLFVGESQEAIGSRGGVKEKSK